MKILVHHSTTEDRYYDISTDTRRRGAYLHLFNFLGENGFYDNDVFPTDKEQWLFDGACKGNARSTMNFIRLRSDLGYEGERVEEIEPLCHEDDAG